MKFHKISEIPQFELFISQQYLEPITTNLKLNDVHIPALFFQCTGSSGILKFVATSQEGTEQVLEKLYLPFTTKLVLFIPTDHNQSLTRLLAKIGCKVNIIAVYLGNDCIVLDSNDIGKAKAILESEDPVIKCVTPKCCGRKRCDCCH